MKRNVRKRTWLGGSHLQACTTSAAAGLLFALSACASLGPVSEAQPSSSLATPIEEATIAGTVPGMAVLEVRNGRVISERVAGVREAGTQDRIRAGDPWHLGSIGKTLTATLVARLVERGDLSWSATLEELLPDLVGLMRPDYRKVTLLDLVSHRSGLPANTSASFIESFYGDPRPLTEQRVAYIRRALGEAPAAPRGTYNYSNTGFVAAGLAAERVTGRAFETLLKQEVFQPLGMKSAGFGPTSRGQPLGHIDGVALLPPRGDNPLMWAPAGGMHMSLQDWAKFAVDQMKGPKGEGRLLKAAGYRFLHTPLREGAAVAWGVQDKPYGPFLIHSGSNGAWHAVTALAPDLLSALVIATNADEEEGVVAIGRSVEAITAQWTGGPR